LKPFGFEGVIQHYAAKHTSLLSLGSIVVHWRAEWPEHPPFSATARIASPISHPPGFGVNGGPPLAYTYPPRGTVSALPTPAYPPPVGYGYAPTTYNDYSQQQPLLQMPYQPYPSAPALFMPQPGYEQPSPYIAPPAPYPSYQPPAAPYATPVVQRGQIHMASLGVPYDYPYGSYLAANASAPYAPPQTSAYPDLHQAKVEDIARNAREVWRLLGDIRDLSGSVKVVVTIYHLVRRFQSKFYETPPLSMFIDGLSNNKEMRPVRNINGLVCKACHLGLGNAASVEKDRKEFSLPQLANHFQSKHVEPMQRMQGPSKPLDWVLDMVFVSDRTVSTSLALPVSEPQRVLLSAALLDAPASQQQDRRHELFGPEGHPTSIEDAQEGLESSNIHTNRDDAAGPRRLAPLADYRIPNQSPQSTTPGTLSEGGRSTQSERVRRSSQGLKPTRGKLAGKHKRAKPQQGASSSGNRPLSKRFKTAKGERAREGTGVRNTPAANQADTSWTQLSSAMPEERVARVATQAEEPTRPSSQPPQQLGRKHLASLADAEQEANVMGALESYLEHTQLPQPQGQPATASLASHDKHRESGVLAQSWSGPGMHARYVGRADSARSSLPSTRTRSPTARQVDAVSFSRPMMVERREDGSGSQRTRARFIEPLRRHAEDERLDLPASRAEGHGHNAPPAVTEYRQHQDNVRMRSRPPVETYEIVHVIDEQGEYYIRRPVRRDPEARYVYEERRVRHESGPSPGFEPVYAPVSRPSLVREAPGRRTDSTYVEEYDPRFPAA
jgi:hypothetical protein